MNGLEALKYLDDHNLNWHDNPTKEKVSIVKKELEDFEWLKSKLNLQFLNTLSLEDKVKVLEILGVQVTY